MDHPELAIGKPDVQIAVGQQQHRATQLDDGLRKRRLTEERANDAGHCLERPLEGRGLQDALLDFRALEQAGRIGTFLLPARAVPRDEACGSGPV